MCDGGLISGPLMAALVGEAAAAATATTAATAATAGLFGAGGVFGAGLTAAGTAAVTAGSIASTAMNVVGIAGSLLSGVSSIAQGQQAQNAAEYNAKIQNMQAKDELRRGSILEGRKRTEYEQLIGKQRAMMGASGIVADEGSFGDLLAQTAEFGERDAQQIRANAARAAWGHQAQAELDQYQGEQAATAGYMKAGTTLLGGAFDLMKGSPWWQSWSAQQSAYAAANALGSAPAPMFGPALKDPRSITTWV